MRVAKAVLVKPIVPESIEEDGVAMFDAESMMICEECQIDDIVRR